MKKIICFFRKKKKPATIKGFDEAMFLDANPDIREAIENGQFQSVSHHLMLFGIEEIRKGLRPFHRAHEVFDEKKYLQYFPKLEKAIEKGEFLTPFDHFCQIGYQKILEEKRDRLAGFSGEEKKGAGEFLYAIDRVTRHEITGWVIEKEKWQGDLDLALYIDGNYVTTVSSNLVRTDVSEKYGIKKCGFFYRFERNVQEKKAFSFEMKVCTEEKGEVLLTSVPLFISDASALMETLFEVQNFLKRKGEESVVNEMLRKVFERFITDGRGHYTQDVISASALLTSLAEFQYDFSQNEKREEGVDVIVPVYKNTKVTKACIESLLKAKNRTKHHIVLINDQSPDADMRKMLQQYADYEQITVLENETNLGFVKTVNRGMKLSQNNVVLLNSDTIVTDGWIDKLHHTAAGDPTIATVTPLSNSATILSYPRTLIDNPLPEGFSPDILNRLFETLHKGKVVDLPTAHGFCMYIRRTALEELGYFNEEKYGKGYGEENDFSMRALTMGWRNVASCDTFIAHVGSVSFSKERDALLQQNLEVLNREYPEYSAMVMRFIAKDPLRVVRRAVSKEILKTLSGRYMLFISHSLGGGTEKAMRDLASLLKNEEVSLLVLKEESGIYKVGTYNNDFLLEYGKEEWNTLLEDLKEMQVFHIHIHHLLGIGWQVMEIPEYLKVPYDFTVHDYTAVCPRINLVDKKSIYCGEPDLSSCQQCIEESGSYPGIESMFAEVGSSMERWRERFMSFLAGARKVFVPDADVVYHMKQHYPGIDFTVRPHPEKQQNVQVVSPFFQEKKNILNVAIIGAISDIKGYRQLKALVKDAQKRSLPICFVVIGYTRNDDCFKEYKNIVITGKYEEKELYTYIEKYQCTVALFLSVWPETYSYTLTESLRAELFPVAYDIGAIASRLKELDVGELLPIASTVEMINDRLLSIPSIKEKHFVLGYTYDTLLKNYYQLNA